MIKVFISFIVFILIFFVSNAQVESQWRGKDRNGLYNERNLLSVWPSGGPKLLWSYDKLGQGFSSPTVTKENLFIADEKDSIGYACCFDHSGQLLWRVKYGKEWHEAHPGARSTFTFYQDKLYMLTAYGVAICLDAKNGNKVWENDLKKSFGARVPKFGMVESPVIYNNKVYFSPSGEMTSMVALDLDNGNMVWQSPSIRNMSSYCSPQLIDVNGRKEIVNSFSDSIAAFAAENGEFLWAFRQKNQYGNHCNTPLYNNLFLYSTTGYGAGGIMLRISEDGKMVVPKWKDSLLDNQMGGVVLFRSMIIGSGHKNKAWYALDWETGRVKFTNKDIGVGAIILSDDHLYLYSDKGELALMMMTSTGFKLVSKMNIVKGDGPHWSHPVIKDGVLYLHHGSSLMAFSLTQPK